MDPRTLAGQAPPDELQELRRYLRDLVTLSTLPAVWVGQSPQAIITSFADALLATLRVDFVYVRVMSGANAAPAAETAHTKVGPASRERARDIGRALAPWLKPDEDLRVPWIPSPTGEGSV